MRQKIKDFENATSKRPEKIHQLKQSDELYRLLVEQSNEAILVIQNEKIRYANTKASEITGFSRNELYTRPFEEFRNLNFADLLTQESIGKQLERYEKILKTAG